MEHSQRQLTPEAWPGAEGGARLESGSQPPPGRRRAGCAKYGQSGSGWQTSRRRVGPHGGAEAGWR